MKRIDFERYLREQGCVPYREDRGHSIWLNPSQRKSPVSLVIAVRAICKQFEIPQPWGHSSPITGSRLPSVIQRLFGTVSHPLEYYSKALLFYRLIVGSLEPIASRIIAQGVSRTRIVDVTQLEKNFGEAAVPRCDSIADMNRIRVEVRRIDRAAIIDMIDRHNVASVGAAPAAFKLLESRIVFDRSRIGSVRFIYRVRHRRNRWRF
jgi:hypothetical protein